MFGAFADPLEGCCRRCGRELRSSAVTGYCGSPACRTWAYHHDPGFRRRMLAASKRWYWKRRAKARV